MTRCKHGIDIDKGRCSTCDEYGFKPINNQPPLDLIVNRTPVDNSGKTPGDLPWGNDHKNHIPGQELKTLASPHHQNEQNKEKSIMTTPENTEEPIICNNEGCENPAMLRKDGKILNGKCKTCHGNSLKGKNGMKKIKKKPAEISPGPPPKTESDEKRIESLAITKLVDAQKLIEALIMVGRGDEAKKQVKLLAERCA